MKKIVVLNHKMYLTYDEACLLKSGYDEINLNNVDLIVCPSYLNLHIFNNYNIGAQNCFYEDTGAYTGEVSAYQLSLRNVRYSIIGHSERRNIETDEVINKKVKACQRNGITPILCIGETKYQKEMMKTGEVLKKQLKRGLDGINKEDVIYVAYEPIYNIGSKKKLKLSDINDALIYIRKTLEEMKIYNYKLLYGGSVTKENIPNIISDNIDGYLIGHASVKKDEIKYIINCIKSVK